ncbi:MAG: sulfatase [Pirellulaceae bacterium]|nr:MAG: sulfatase [Pirellulaceae bacterium]
MVPEDQIRRHVTRRALLARGSVGLGAIALSTLLGREERSLASSSVGLPDLPHFAPKARRVIYLLQNGAPSHVDLFDYKPMLERMHGQQIPDSVVGGKRFSTMTGTQTERPCLQAIARLRQHGESGATVSDFLPHTASIVDKLCFIKSMHTTQVNHAPAITYFLTGDERPGRPSMGAWLSYGLGTENEDLPTFVAMTSRDKEASCGQIFYDYYWGSGFLPTVHQGVKFRGSGDPVLYLSDPPGMARSHRRAMLSDLRALNELHLQEMGDPETATRIAQYEMAYRMQASVPELTDLSTETAATLEMYGPDVTTKGSYAYNCLIARRLAERGCRFIQLMHAGWDQHRNLNTQLEIQCRDTDAPSAALVKDLEQRGLLDDTLVIWGGEFGRTPFLQGKISETQSWGRDHHPYAFTIWMAGGGIKPGITYGESDEFGFNVVRDGVTVHDFQATILHLLGIDHERLTYRFQGRRFRLTDVGGRVITPILA